MFLQINSEILLFSRCPNERVSYQVDVKAFGNLGCGLGRGEKNGWGLK